MRKPFGDRPTPTFLGLQIKHRTVANILARFRRDSKLGEGRSQLLRDDHAHRLKQAADEAQRTNRRVVVELKLFNRK